MALAVALAACGLSPEALLERASAAYAEHRYTEARLDLATFLKERPSDPAALELYARTQLQLGEGEGAAATLARLKQTGTVPKDFAMLRAEAELLRGNYAEALAMAQPMSDANGARIAALAHIGLGDTDAALASFEDGMTRGGNTSRLAADFAVFTMQTGDLERASAMANAARKIDPDGLDPLIASARVARAQGQYAAALVHYEKASRIYPETRAAIIGRIVMLAELGRDAEAKSLLASAAARAPEDSEIRYLQARYAAEANDWAQVRDLLQDQHGDTAPAAQLLYGRALLELGLHEQAIARLSSLLRRETASAEARRLLARAQLAGGNPQQAYATISPLASSAQGTPADIALLGEAARLSGRTKSGTEALASAPPAERLALLLANGDQALREGRWRAAIDAYEQLRGWTGDSNALVLNNLAYARSKTGANTEALRLARKALALAPDHPSVMDTAGWLMIQTGEDRSKGVALLREAARLAPDNATIADHLARATTS